MATLRDIRRRITSIKNTQQITKAMKMVAAAKLRRAQENIIEARPYAIKLRDVLGSLSLRTDPRAHPLLARREVRRVEIIPISSDRGLCGAFNQNVFRITERFIRENREFYDGITLSTIGRKALEYFSRRNYTIRSKYVGIFGTLTYETASAVAGEVIGAYTGETIDEIYLVYNEFRSAISQRPVMVKLLPIDPIPVEPGYVVTSYMYEPSEAEILETLLPRYVEYQLYRALLESQASEHGARMTAMDSATNNAEEMLGRLTLHYNRVRQAAITKELMDIIGGAEALK
ncbi:MAG: ATP synthase F1 subunit gamma [Deltaproteobacteria bacterium]|nr:ATP synthase F1 subunit gamma [Deltaproteobacteria bacterium]